MESIVKLLNSFLWDFALLFLLCGTGNLFYFSAEIRAGAPFWGGDAGRVFGRVQACAGCQAEGVGPDLLPGRWPPPVAAQVGTGNIAGAAAEPLPAGRPGRHLLDVAHPPFLAWPPSTPRRRWPRPTTRRVAGDGSVTGGPVYYIKARPFRGRFGSISGGLLFAVATHRGPGLHGRAWCSPTPSAHALQQPPSAPRRWAVGVAGRRVLAAVVLSRRQPAASPRSRKRSCR